MVIAQTSAWTLFCLTSAYLAFVAPYFATLFPEEADMVNGLVCTLSLTFVLMSAGRRGVELNVRYLIVSIVLLLLAILAASSGFTPVTSSMRAFVLVSAALGGFWAGQILGNDEPGKRFLAYFFSALLGGYLLVTLLIYFLWGQGSYSQLDPNPTTLINRFLLFSFGPIALVTMGNRRLVGLGIVLLIGTYLAVWTDALLFKRFIHTAVVIITALGFVGLVLMRWRRKRLVLLLAGAVAATLLVMYVMVPLQARVKSIMADTRTLYRIESYPFSWYIASRHPMFGIGLATVRNEFLHSYPKQVKSWAGTTTFDDMVKEIKSSDNVFLDLMVGMGLPFTVLYGLMVVILVVKLFGAVMRPPPTFPFHPVAVLVPVIAALMHFMDLNGLLHVEVCWYFHILLGLVPGRRESAA